MTPESGDLLRIGVRVWWLRQWRDDGRLVVTRSVELDSEKEASPVLEWFMSEPANGLQVAIELLRYADVPAPDWRRLLLGLQIGALAEPVRLPLLGPEAVADLRLKVSCGALRPELLLTVDLSPKAGQNNSGRVHFMTATLGQVAQDPLARACRELAGGQLQVPRSPGGPRVRRSTWMDEVRWGQDGPTPPASALSGPTGVTLHGARGVQVGDHNLQVNNFRTEVKILVSMFHIDRGVGPGDLNGIFGVEAVQDGIGQLQQSPNDEVARAKVASLLADAAQAPVRVSPVFLPAPVEDVALHRLLAALLAFSAGAPGAGDDEDTYLAPATREVSALLTDFPRVTRTLADLIVGGDRDLAVLRRGTRAVRDLMPQEALPEPAILYGPGGGELLRVERINQMVADADGGISSVRDARVTALDFPTLRKDRVERTAQAEGEIVPLRRASRQ
ncbi:hypothetical protein ACWT_3399 [Actinoplanes sp. SE50]|uniref:RIP homotypic interaction motif-containing protein n=1 Tax=unclassified Actinoplanes TaxID=2626549 RepID=UPI00023ED423|nr:MULTISPECIES: RIP homotypic interaction motif-containing protein [unclassified Actinoplanes]AEV84422.1 hypothetical protein ACPL_3527 [Actinoplanes sp. SE50/110]ATO82814.1 hypothetical protein ACWT_3399 [Actinoplanes sp. SE50]SLM00222.1 hypothetical protein ACSP50_3454 [Actinoplanes sp. SE50/110]